MKNGRRHKQSITVDMRTVGEMKLDGEGVIMIRTNLDTLKLYFNGANIQHIDYTITRPEEIYITDGKSSLSKERAIIAINDDEDFVNEQIRLLETNGGKKIVSLDYEFFSKSTTDTELWGIEKKVRVT